METQEKLVALADRMIRMQGYNAFSYKDLSGPMHIKNAAVHYYYPTKADLGVAVIDQTIREINQSKQRWADLPVDQQLEQFAQLYARDHEAELVCLMGSLAPDYRTLPETMQTKVQQMGEEILDWLTDCLTKGREQGLFRFQGAPYDRALLVISTLLSALLLARVLGGDTFQRMYRQLLADIMG